MLLFSILIVVVFLWCFVRVVKSPAGKWVLWLAGIVPLLAVLLQLPAPPTWWSRIVANGLTIAYLAAPVWFLVRRSKRGSGVSS